MKKMLFFRAFALSFFALFFISCASKNPAQNSEQYESKAVQMLIISPLVRINDAGFIHFNKNALKVQIYSAGAGLFELKIAEKICINSTCYAPKDFNVKFLGDIYYENILADVIASKPLYNRKPQPNLCGGFSQSFADISYEVCADRTSFKSKKAKIEFSAGNDKEF